MDNTWLIIHTPDGAYLWNLGGPSSDVLDDLVNAARVTVGFPAHDNWIADGSGYSLHVTFGDSLHESLMARAVVGTVAELGKVTKAAKAAHAAARRESLRRQHIDLLKAALAGLDDEARAEVLGL